MAEQSFTNGFDGAADARGTHTGPDLRDRVAAAASAQKDRAADRLDSMADTARLASDQLRASSNLVASWIDAAGSQLLHVADGLRDKEPGELLDEVTALARRRPALFLGGAFLLGVGVAQLVRNGTVPRLAAVVGTAVGRDYVRHAASGRARREQGDTEPAPIF